MRTTTRRNEKKIADILQDFAKRHPDTEWSTTLLLGSTGRGQAEYLAELGIGEMWSEGLPEPYPDQPWAFDNGAWAAWDELGGEGRPLRPEEFPETEFLTRLENAYHLVPSDPLLAVVPDLVQAGMESLEFSVRWLDQLEDRGYGDWDWYLAVQGGMRREAVAEVLPRFDGLFFGGGDSFKGTATEWRDLARQADLPFHYGQCGTYGKLADAADLDVDSLDSAGPLMTRDGLVSFLRHCEELFAEETD